MDTYLTVSEVAEMVKLSVPTIRRYTMSREIPFHKINRAVRFKLSEIELWVESKAAGMSVTQSESLDEVFCEYEQTEGSEA